MSLIEDSIEEEESIEDDCDIDSDEDSDAKSDKSTDEKASPIDWEKKYRFYNRPSPLVTGELLTLREHYKKESIIHQKFLKNYCLLSHIHMNQFTIQIRTTECF